MSEELKNCLFCGSEAREPIGTYGGHHTGCTGPADCPLYTLLFEVEEWNKRFVCHDKNGKKVFEGDEVKLTCDDEGYELESEITREPCVWDGEPIPVFNRELETEITLIEKAKE